MSATHTNMADYEEARRRFRLEVPAEFNYARDVVDEQARVRPAGLGLLALDRHGENPEG